MICEKHPLASRHGQLCPVCLFEQALESHEPFRQLTIRLPLGIGPTASVFLVAQEGPSAGLLRLKIWHKTAPPDFLDRFRVLQQGLEEYAAPSIDRPLAACVDVTGRPSVLSPFRQGVPILDAVSSGLFHAPDAIAVMAPLHNVLRRAHADGLAHGSIVPGNVLVQPDLATAFLVDFGLAPLLQPATPLATWFASDVTGLESLCVTFRPTS